MTLLPSSERGVLRDEPSDHLPRRKAPKELSRAAKALKERDRNAQAPKRLAEPQLELKPRGPRGGDLHKSTDKLNDILQFLNRADTSIDLDRSGSSRESGGDVAPVLGQAPGPLACPCRPPLSRPRPRPWELRARRLRGSGTSRTHAMGSRAWAYWTRTRGRIRALPFAASAPASRTK